MLHLHALLLLLEIGAIVVGMLRQPQQQSLS